MEVKAKKLEIPGNNTRKKDNCCHWYSSSNNYEPYTFLKKIISGRKCLFGSKLFGYGMPKIYSYLCRYSKLQNLISFGQVYRRLRQLHQNLSCQMAAYPGIFFSSKISFSALCIYSFDELFYLINLAYFWVFQSLKWYPFYQRLSSTPFEVVFRMLLERIMNVLFIVLFRIQ